MRTDHPGPVVRFKIQIQLTYSTFVSDPESTAMSLTTNQDIDPSKLRQAFGFFPSGVVAVAAEVDGDITGLAASSFTSVSLDPPLVSISLASTSKTWPDLRRARHLGLTVLAEHHADVCRQLSGPVEQRFDDVAITTSPEGAVTLDEGIASFDCTVYEEVKAGDHLVVILALHSFDHDNDDATPPLVFHKSGFAKLARPTGLRYKELAATETPIAPVLAERWSPRSFDPAYTIDDETVTSLLEAARWAPSGSNHQARRFIVGRRGTETFDKIASTLSAGNQRWAPRASLLVLAIRIDHDAEGTVHRHADYDTGQSIAHLQIQAANLGLASRQMGGFDPIRAAELFGLEAPYFVSTVTAVGKSGRLDDLDADTIEREREPRERLPLSELVLVRD